jgi:hypothetical protein
LSGAILAVTPKLRLLLIDFIDDSVDFDLCHSPRRPHFSVDGGCHWAVKKAPTAPENTVQKCM